MVDYGTVCRATMRGMAPPSSVDPIVLSYQGTMPFVPPTVYLAPGACLIGHVTLGEHVSVWCHAVLRGDINKITVGARTNLQDGCVVHVDDDAPCRIGEDVVVGHQATVHGCVVEDACLIGIGARILSKAHIGRGSLVAAGAVVLEGAIVPPASLVVGVPGRVVRSLSDQEIDQHIAAAAHYAELADTYLGAATSTQG